jgi:hypothetical protein
VEPAREGVREDAAARHAAEALGAESATPVAQASPRRRRAAEPAQPPVVNVTIGRVQIRRPAAVEAPVAPAPPPAGPRPMSLDEYLGRP